MGMLIETALKRAGIYVTNTRGEAVSPKSGKITTPAQNAKTVQSRCISAAFIPDMHLQAPTDRDVNPRGNIVRVTIETRRRDRHRKKSRRGVRGWMWSSLQRRFSSFPSFPATNLFFYVGFVIAERILYIPSVGYCLLVAEGVSQIWHRCSETGRKLLIAYAIVHLCLFSAKTLDRNTEWLTEESLYRAGIEVNPPKGQFSVSTAQK